MACRLADLPGNCYGIPRAALEQWRVPEERMAALEEMLGREAVPGFAFDAFRSIALIRTDLTSLNVAQGRVSSFTIMQT